MKRLSIEVTDELHQTLKLKCVKEKISMKKYILECLENQN